VICQDAVATGRVVPSHRPQLDHGKVGSPAAGTLLGYQSALTRGGTVMPSWIYGELSAWRKVSFLYTHRIMTMVRELNEEGTAGRRAPALIDLNQ
jgi:hypothetical protein